MEFWQSKKLEKPWKACENFTNWIILSLFKCDVKHVQQNEKKKKNDCMIVKEKEHSFISVSNQL